jgi:hypothetical protein
VWKQLCCVELESIDARDGCELREGSSDAIYVDSFAYPHSFFTGS